MTDRDPLEWLIGIIGMRSWPASSDNEREQLNGGDPKYQRR